MADEPDKSHSWWSTVPGILTATAAMITAATGLVAILSQSGVFGEKSKAFVSQKAADVRDAVSAPSRSIPFTGAIVIQSDGVAVKLRDDVKEYCTGAPLLKATNGQMIEMRRIARFEVVEECATAGSNDLGDYKRDFETIRSVEFVR